jgi:hypothetical protein
MANRKTAALTSVLDIANIFDLVVDAPFTYVPKGSTQTFVVNQKVYIERVTPDLIEAIQSASEKSEAEALQHIISNTVKAWDIVLKGKMLGTDIETLRKLPMTFLAQSGEAIIALLQGNPPKEPNSQTTSEQVESQAQSPAGTE